ncbi:MAG: NTP transferase domain-containing protein [Candidatus Krumholzibacteria bacterium]|nr:NTP transferase domain-containing protein [Candidatus Krumholzibacteria bacterium]
MTNAAIILAAGKGKRMSSDLPKVLHELGNRPMVSYVLDAVQPIVGDRAYVVVGYRAEEVIEACCNHAVHFVRQEEQLGTGHAVMQCEDALADFSGNVVVLNGDVPGLRSETIRMFLDYHKEHCAAATVLTAVLDNPTGYGRIVTDGDGSLVAIVEEKDADENAKKIAEINSGLFSFDKGKLYDALRSIDRSNAQNEYYLTDVISTLRSKGEIVRAFRVDDAREVAGVNTDDELEAMRDYMEG